MSDYLYCVTSQKSTAVDTSITGYFTDTSIRNLIIVKTTRFEIHLIKDTGLVLLHEIPIRGRIIDIQLFRPVNATLDKLFLLTDTYKWAILSYEPTKQILRTDAYGDFQDRMTRVTEANRMVAIDPDGRVMAFHLYTGLIKILPLTPTEGRPSRDAFDIRIEESVLLDIKFLHHRVRPTLLVLFEDLKWARHIKTYEVYTKERELRDTSVMTVEGNALFFMTIPSENESTTTTTSGASSSSPGKSSVLVVGESLLTLVDLSASAPASRPVTFDIPPTLMKAYTWMDSPAPSNGTARCLLGDYHGKLYLVTIQRKSATSGTSDMYIDILGQTHIPSSLSYLSHGRIFVGCAWSDSQIIQLKTQAQLNAPTSTAVVPSYLTVLDTMTNIGPIVDFLLINVDGQSQMMTCSGTHHDGSLRFIRAGVGFTASAVSDTIRSLRQLFSLSGGLLLLCSMDESRLVHASTFRLCDSPLNGAHTILLAESLSLPATNETVHIIVTRHSVVRYNAAVTQTQFTVPVAHKVLGAQCVSSWVFLWTTREILVVDALTGLLGHRQTLQREPSAVTVTSIRASTACFLVTVAYWVNATIDFFCYRPNEAEASQSLPWRLMKTLQDPPEEGQEAHTKMQVTSMMYLRDFLLIGYADGLVVSYDVDMSGVMQEDLMAECLNVRDRRVFHVGHEKIVFCKMQQDENKEEEEEQQPSVVACTDRPALFYLQHHKIHHAGLQLKHLKSMCRIRSEHGGGGVPRDNSSNATFGSLICLANGTVMVGDMDAAQKLHVRTQLLHEMPRRMACGDKNTLCVLATRSLEDVDQYFVRLFDLQSGDLLASYTLLPNEAAASIARITVEHTVYFMVGTAFVLPQEQEPTRGRLLLLHAETLSLVSEKDIHGVPYSLLAFGEDKVIGAINSKICLFRMDERRNISLECAYHGYTVAVNMKVRIAHHLIYVGDMMKSVSILRYIPSDTGVGRLEEVGRDYHHRWTTSVLDVNERQLLVGENGFYLYSLIEEGEGEPQGATQQRHDIVPLITHGYLYTGEFVTKMAQGSLNFIENKEIKDSFLFVTSSGMIGTVFKIGKELFTLLKSMEKTLAKRGGPFPGHISHEAWRTPKMHSLYLAVEENGIIDGDLVESFLNMEVAERALLMEECKKEYGISKTMDEMMLLIEDMARSH